MRPLLVSASMCVPPAAACTTQWCSSPFTLWGRSLLDPDRSPMPSRPYSPLPQVMTSPSEDRAMECQPPAAMSEMRTCENRWRFR